jgi:hypothetical protein
MVDAEAPIVPGQGAAGIMLGEHIQDVMQRARNLFTCEPLIIAGVGDLGVTRCRSAFVDLWVKNDSIWQIMLHGTYSGKVLGKLGIGSTVAEVRKLLGPFKVDVDDLLIEGLPGISFEFEADQDLSPAMEIYIFEPDWTQLRAVTTYL